MPPRSRRSLLALILFGLLTTPVVLRAQGSPSLRLNPASESVVPQASGSSRIISRPLSHPPRSWTPSPAPPYEIRRAVQEPAAETTEPSMDPPPARRASPRQPAPPLPPAVAAGPRKHGPPTPAPSWKKLIKLIRHNARLKAEVEKIQAIARSELQAVEAKRSALEAQNTALRERIEQLEKRLLQSDQEMTERSIHTEHLERQMMQRSDVIEQLESALQQQRRDADRRESDRDIKRQFDRPQMQNKQREPGPPADRDPSPRQDRNENRREKD